MNIGLLRSFDSTFGTLLCLLLLPLLCIKDLIRGARKCDSQKILFIKFFGVGSLIQAYAMFKAVKERYPDAKIDIITFSGNEQILDQFKVFDMIYLIKTPPISLFGTLIATAAKILFKSYDAVVDMEFFSNGSTFLTCITFAPIRVGYSYTRSIRELLLTRRVYYNPSKHITDVYISLSRSLGCNQSAYPKPQLSGEPNESYMLKQKLKLKEGEQLIVINPNASELCLERRLPIEKFGFILNDILQRHEDIRIALIGTKDEIAYTAKIVSQCNNSERITNLTGKTSTGELTELLKMSRLLISNDSGPVHLANAIDIPVVAFFGPENPLLYGPIGEKNYIFFSGVYCSPCLNTFSYKVAPCKGNNICMKYINENGVAQVVDAILYSHQAPTGQFIKIVYSKDSKSQYDWTLQ